MTAPAHPVLCVAQAHWRTLLDCDWRAPLPAFDANSRSTTAPLASASRALTSHVGLARRARLACRQGGGHHGGVHVMVSGSETWICFTVAARVSILTSHIPPPPTSHSQEEFAKLLQTSAGDRLEWYDDRRAAAATVAVEQQATAETAATGDGDAPSEAV